MKITALVENRSLGKSKAKHGLSLHIETAKHTLLFDLGPDDTLFQNAKVHGIDLAKVDTVILSHGHFDHGGALDRFLQINDHATIYVQRGAFDPHFSKVLFAKIPIGLAQHLRTHPQVKCLDGDARIDEELSLFTVTDARRCHSPANDCLLDSEGRDRFAHEQNLLIHEGESTALIIGCGHAGVVNILEKLGTPHPQLCVGGFHLFDPVLKKSVSLKLLNEMSDALQDYGDTRFYTCHCTGRKAFRVLNDRMPNLMYLHCGDTIQS